MNNVNKASSFLDYTSYVIISKYKEETNEYPSGLYFNKIASLAYRRLKSDGIDIKLPHYWYRYGDQVHQYSMPNNLSWNHESPLKTVVKWGYEAPMPLHTETETYKSIDKVVSELTERYAHNEFEAVREVYKHAPFKFQQKFLNLRETFYGRSKALNWDSNAYKEISKPIFKSTFNSFPKHKFPSLVHQYKVVRDFINEYTDNNYDYNLLQDTCTNFWFLFCYHLRLNKEARENIPKQTISHWESKLQFENTRYRRIISDLITAACKDKPYLLDNDLIREEYEWREKDLKNADEVIDQFFSEIEESGTSISKFSVS